MKRLLILGGALAVTACIPPRVLVSEELVGPRSVKYTLQLNDQGDRLYNFSTRVCDFDSHGNEVNCADTLLLADVVYRPTPRSF